MFLVSLCCIAMIKEGMKRHSTFLSLRVFELLSSSLLLFSQRFGRYVLRPSSGVCRSRELRTTSFIESTGVTFSDPVSQPGTSVKLFLYCYSPAVRIKPATSRRLRERERERERDTHTHTHTQRNEGLLYWPLTGTLAQRLECSPMARETWVQSQVESYQRL